LARKRPCALAGFFRLERLLVQRLAVLDRGLRFVFEIGEATVEAG
jgi:hypothetical protein